MGLLVLKFGGTSVANTWSIQAAAKRVAEFADAGHKLVVVVSAMGSTTDELVKMAKDLCEKPAPRELDVLLSSGEQVSIALMAIALESLGYPAVSFTGSQLGVRTSGVHTRARIHSIPDGPITRAHEAGRIAVVAGFQGVTEAGHITTLGRGGSDTTAVAIAASIGADACEIFTDVDGVFTADPRRVPNARKLNRISYDEMLELAVLGAGVMHPRSVLFGQKYGILIHVRNSQRAEPGTIITGVNPMMEEPSVIGCALKNDLGRVTLLGVPNVPGTQARIFSALTEAEVFVDDIIQTQSGPDRANISFTVEETTLSEVRPAMEAFLREIGQGELDIDIGLAKVSVVGLGMRSQTGVAATMFDALRIANVEIANITTSEIKISCIINETDGDRAIQAVHDVFELGREPHREDRLGEMARDLPIRSPSVLLSEAVREQPPNQPNE